MDLISSGFFSAGGFLAAPAFFFPPKLFNTNTLLPSLPLASCLEHPSYLIWLLGMPYLLGVCDSWSGKYWCSRAWFLHMNLVSTWLSGFSVDSSSGLCDESSCYKKADNSIINSLYITHISEVSDSVKLNKNYCEYQNFTVVLGVLFGFLGFSRFC